MRVIVLVTKAISEYYYTQSAHLAKLAARSSPLFIFIYSLLLAGLRDFYEFFFRGQEKQNRRSEGGRQGEGERGEENKQNFDNATVCKLKAMTPSPTPSSSSSLNSDGFKSRLN